MGNSKTPDVLYEGQPTPLVELNDDAQKMWNHLMNVIPKTILANADSATLTIMCREWSVYLKMSGKYEQTENWNDYSAKMAALKQFNGWAIHFGLTPFARTKIKPKGIGNDVDADPLAASIAGVAGKDFKVIS